MKDSYALITGASSGIGLEIADYMAKKGFNLIITSRTESKLKKLSQVLVSKYKVKVDVFSN